MGAENHQSLATLKKEDVLSHSSVSPEDYYYVKTDNMFTRKARLLQAIRRYQSGAGCGSITRNGITYFHPNLAIDGSKTGCNFLDDGIFAYAQERVNDKKSYETIEEERLFNNFLSSQPMAFNLFFPLMKIINKEEAQTTLANVISELIDNEGSLEIERITEVGIEYIPCYYKDCLNDKTAMDAYFRYLTKDGKRGIIAVETKYTDILGQNEASNPTLAKRIATQDLSVLFTASAIAKIKDGEIKLSQVFRNFLLTETVRLHENIDESLSIVVAPKENTSNKHDETLLKECLKHEFKYKFQVVSLESLVDAIIYAFPDEPIFKAFKNRYLDFSLAEWVMENKLR